VIVSRFQGASRDGHGHHEAAGILSREAFRAAADPNRFPEQIREGLQPWQAKKLYVDNIRAGEDYTVRLETTVNDALLGTSYAAFAMQGLKHQLSQGAGQWNLPSGPRYATYKLVDSVIPSAADKDGHEPDLFAGIDTTLPGLAARGHVDAVPDLKRKLEAIAAKVQEATTAAERNPYDAATPLFSGLELTRKLIAEVDGGHSPDAQERELLDALRAKERQFERAVALALDVTAVADSRYILSSIGRPGDEIMAAGGSARVMVSVQLPSGRNIKLDGMHLELPPGWSSAPTSLPAGMPPRDGSYADFTVTVPADASLARPQFRRDDPEHETVYSVADRGDPTRPFPPPPVFVRVNYRWNGHRAALRTVAGASERRNDPGAHEEVVPFAVAPPLSVLVEPASLLLPAGSSRPIEVTVLVTNYKQGQNAVSVRIDGPKGWAVQPAGQELSFASLREQKWAKFRVLPGPSSEEHYKLRAIAESGGKSYTEGFSIVTREDLGVFYYYQPAIQKISAVKVQLPDKLKVGYLMGAGDDIPTALQQLGLDVHLITPDELAKGDLAQFDTIVLGIRAYDTRGDLKQHNQRLLEYVHNGGTLIVQYNASVQDFNSGGFTPYPAQLSRDRVSVETAPVEMRAPADPLLHYPNPISARDFDGWIQERGLYFMHEWDKAYEPLLATSDPGEPPLRGGLLRSRYGKGTYIYTGLSFFRQIPAGVPGAVRLFVNLLAAGHDGTAAQPSNQGPRP
jgi:hypothetical protein